LTITREIKEKVIQLSKEERGRNEIARLLTGQGLHISEGSVGNIIRTYREHSLQQSLQQNTKPSQPSLQNNTDIITSIPIKRDGSSLLSGSELAVTSTPRDGGPLSHLVTNEDDKDTTINPDPPSTIDPGSELDFDNKPYHEFYPYPNPNPIEPGQDEETEEEERQPRSEDAPRGIDWDSDESFERRFWARIMEEKEEKLKMLQLIEQRKQGLQEKEEQIAQMIQLVDQRTDDLRGREAKIKEIEPLLPSVRELQENGITFDIVLPYVLAINERSALENINLKAAAYNMMEEFRALRTLENIRIVIDKAETYSKALGNSIRQKEAAIATLVNLKAMGYTKKDIVGLVELVRNWNGNNGHVKQLDTELRDFHQPGNGANNNLQKSNNLTNKNGSSSGSPLGKNGHDGPSMNDFVRLNLLRGATSNMLNRMGTIH
jgi:hypothetical protein